MSPPGARWRVPHPEVLWLPSHSRQYSECQRGAEKAGESGKRRCVGLDGGGEEREERDSEYEEPGQKKGHKRNQREEPEERKQREERRGGSLKWTTGTHRQERRGARLKGNHMRPQPTTFLEERGSTRYGSSWGMERGIDRK
ncbi:hypothetical protein NDU88_003284 [Pleurodeles waltl]|uniref:Uncharacterized protein n=1 Tax=Pleurodeles waltl TaxID=8319 RepID=A0AAV7UFN7_PLEWA|nr:hypothetical protein NDU88_003284 [Pleurodeles waltl]